MRIEDLNAAQINGWFYKYPVLIFCCFRFHLGVCYRLDRSRSWCEMIWRHQKKTKKQTQLFQTDDFPNDSNQHAHLTVVHDFHCTKEVKVSLSNENTILKTSNQRAMCNEGKVMRKISDIYGWKGTWTLIAYVQVKWSSLKLSQSKSHWWMSEFYQSGHNKAVVVK